MNHTRGFIVPALAILIALILIGGGAYVATKNHSPEFSLGANATSTAKSESGSRSEETPAQSVALNPSIKSATPSSGPIGTIVTLKGWFPAGATIMFDGHDIGNIATDTSKYLFVVPPSFQITVGRLGPPEDLITPGKHTISLSGAATSIGFSVVPTPPMTSSSTPVVASSSVSHLTVGSSREVTLYGSNFRSTNVVAILGGGMSLSFVGPDKVAPDGSSLTFTFPADIIIPAIYAIEAYNKGDIQQFTVFSYGHSSNSTALIQLDNPNVPVLSSINPKSPRAGDTVTITGSNFYGNTQIYASIYVALPLPTAKENHAIQIAPIGNTATTLIFTVPATMSAGQYEIGTIGTRGLHSNSLILTVAP